MMRTAPGRGAVAACMTMGLLWACSCGESTPDTYEATYTQEARLLVPTEHAARFDAPEVQPGERVVFAFQRDDSSLTTQGGERSWEVFVEVRPALLGGGTVDLAGEEVVVWGSYQGGELYCVMQEPTGTLRLEPKVEGIDAIPGRLTLTFGSRRCADSEPEEDDEDTVFFQGAFEASSGPLEVE